MMTLTESATAKLHELIAEEGNPELKLRVFVQGGGCSGMTYVLGFEAPQADDEVYEFESIPFVMNKSHELYLYGMQIDWQGGLNSRGFTFSNPNASKTCGCGTSFAV